VPTDQFAALVAETAALAEEFRQAGKTLYLVGGIVRDTLLSRHRDELDIDLTTDALPEEIERIVQKSRPTAVWTQGKKFGTIGATIPGPGGTRAVEITTHRAEQYYDDSRKPEVRFSTDITVDLSRRDFTINAMAYDVHGLELLDPFKGRADLRDRVLRTPLSPEISFRDDPLRMLRAARFVSGLELAPDPALIAAVREHGHRLSIVSSERIRGELVKLLALEDPSAGLRLLASTALLDRFLPELTAGIESAIARVARLVPEWHVRFAALVWDAFTSERTARSRLRALRCSSEEELFLARMLQLKTVDLASAMATDAGARRFSRQAGDNREAFLTVATVAAEVDAANVDPSVTAARLGTLRALRARLAVLGEREDLSRLTPEIDGDDVMRLLQLPPGPDVGRALHVLLDLRLDRGPVGRIEAERHLLEWWKDHGNRPVTTDR
jgi:poly(A) polymerase